MIKVYILVLTLYQDCSVNHVLDYNLTGTDCLERMQDFLVMQESVGNLSCQLYRGNR